MYCILKDKYFCKRSLVEQQIQLFSWSADATAPNTQASFCFVFKLQGVGLFQNIAALHGERPPTLPPVLCCTLRCPPQDAASSPLSGLSDTEQRHAAAGRLSAAVVQSQQQENGMDCGCLMYLTARQHTGVCVLPQSRMVKPRAPNVLYMLMYCIRSRTMLCPAPSCNVARRTRSRRGWTSRK